MRVADNMAFDQVRGNISKNRSQMSDLQNQAATQKRVTKPSDDPISASRVLHSRIDLEGNKQYIKNLNYARSYLEMTDQALSEVAETLMRAKELALSQSNDASANEQSRGVVATEVEQIHDQIVNIGNRKMGDRFIFGGFKTQNRPFDAVGNYHGDSGEMLIHIDKASFLAMNVAGSRVFLGQGFTSDGALPVTPEQAVNIKEFKAQKKEQNDSASQTNHVDLRAPASLGAPRSVMGQGAGDQKPEATGSNLFKVLKNLEISLRVNDKVGVQESLDEIDQALQQVVLARSHVGSRGMAVDNFLQSLEKSKVDNLAAISHFEDADVFATISDINKTEGTLQATLQTSGKLVQSSLLDFLR